MFVKCVKKNQPTADLKIGKIYNCLYEYDNHYLIELIMHNPYSVKIFEKSNFEKISDGIIIKALEEYKNSYDN